MHWKEEAFFQFRSRARFKMDRGIGVMGAIKPPKEALDGLDSAQRTQFDQLCQRGKTSLYDLCPGQYLPSHLRSSRKR